MTHHRHITELPISRSTSPSDRRLRFSFQFLDVTNPAFVVARRSESYYHTLLARLKELSTLQVSEFRSSRSSTLRIHRIDFRDSRVSVRGFGIPGGEHYDRQAWQFSLSANEHGRVHGFLIEDTFFVRWLDPEHNLYPGG